MNLLKESKHPIGMYEYQVRGWLAWHHPIALSMMATYFMQSERLLYQNQLPLLSSNDIRAALLRTYASDAISDEQFMQILKKTSTKKKRH
jgi:hypothetical protein